MYFKLVECSCCGRLFDPDEEGVEIDGEFFCDECAEELELEEAA